MNNKSGKQQISRVDVSRTLGVDVMEKRLFLLQVDVTIQLVPDLKLLVDIICCRQT
jgi:hypothetical protein